MKVLYDHQIFAVQEYGGISRYYYELTKGLPVLGVDVENTTKYSNNVYATTSPINSKKFFPKKNFKGKLRALIELNKVISLCKINKGNFDLLHPTNYETYFLPKIKKPFVVTFHDLINEKFACKFDELKADKTLIQRRRQLLEQASKVVAVSQSTKNDVIEYYKVDPGKIEVIHLASSISLSKSTSANDLGDYILYVGVRIIYKNFLFFTKSIAPLLKNEPNLKLICAGGGAFSTEEVEVLQKLGISKNVIQIDIENNNLASLYKNALMFVFPSLYEGFGIPTIEAFNCSCPCVLSRTSALIEVGQDAAVYFDPNDSDDILNTVQNVLYDNELRQKMIVNGIARGQEFSWGKTVVKHKELYKAAL